MNKISCDSSSLISLSDNCLLCILGKFKNTEFIIPKGVEDEIISHPLKTRRFKLKAIQMKKSLENGIIKIIDDPFIMEYSKKITDLANSLFEYRGKYLKILDKGEAESIACLKLLNENTLLIDERTARQLIENPLRLREYMEHITGFQLKINEKALGELQEELKGIQVIRSAEIMAYAYKKDLLPGYEKEGLLEACLYAVKFSGCSITNDEIGEYLNLLG